LVLPNQDQHVPKAADSQSQDGTTSVVRWKKNVIIQHEDQVSDETVTVTIKLT